MENQIDDFSDMETEYYLENGYYTVEDRRLYIKRRIYDPHF